MTTTTDNPIAEYLKTYHKGAQSVISSRELEAAFHIRVEMASPSAVLTPAITTPVLRKNCREPSGSSGAGSRRSPMRNAVSPRRWSNPPTADRYPFRWRAVIPLEKLHPLGGR